MKRIPFFLILTLGMAMMATLPSCNQVGCMEPTALNYDPEATKASDDCSYPFLSLKMTPVVNGERFSFGEVYSINGVNASFSQFQFYVSKAGVGTEGVFETPDTYLLVKADQSNYELGQITAGHKHMLRFNIGVDSLANHKDPTTYDANHPLAPQNPSMHWSWDKGYIFLRIEGMVDTDGDGTVDDPMEIHIGKDSNRRMFMAEGHKDADVEDFVIEVEYDVAKFFNGVDLSADRVTHTADNPGLALSVANNLVEAFAIQ